MIINTYYIFLTSDLQQFDINTYFIKNKDMSESEEKGGAMLKNEYIQEEEPMVKLEEHPVQEIQRVFHPEELQQIHRSHLPKLITKQIDRRKHKGTNIPKFLLKVFFNNMPEFPDSKHIERLIQFIKRPEKSKTRFHLVELFGTNDNARLDRENQLNRRVLKRLLTRNYDNILTNKHIRNKRLYLLFCKKMLLRLNKPELIDRLQI